MRIVFFVILILTALFLPWIFFAVLSIAYAFRYNAPELLGLGFFLDAVFGNPLPWLPITALYTLLLFGILLCSWGIKSFFSLHTVET